MLVVMVVRAGKKRSMLFWCAEAQDSSQESRPRCVVVVHQRSDRGGLLERTSHRFIAAAAANRGAGPPRAKTLGRRSRNPLVRVTDEGRGLRSMVRAAGAPSIRG